MQLEVKGRYKTVIGTVFTVLTIDKDGRFKCSDGMDRFIDGTCGRSNLLYADERLAPEQTMTDIVGKYLFLAVELLIVASAAFLTSVAELHTISVLLGLFGGAGVARKIYR